MMTDWQFHVYYSEMCHCWTVTVHSGDCRSAMHATQDATNKYAALMEAEAWTAEYERTHREDDTEEWTALEPKEKAD